MKDKEIKTEETPAASLRDVGPRDMLLRDIDSAVIIGYARHRGFGGRSIGGNPIGYVCKSDGTDSYLSILTSRDFYKMEESYISFRQNPDKSRKLILSAREAIDKEDCAFSTGEEKIDHQMNELLPEISKAVGMLLEDEVLSAGGDPTPKMDRNLDGVCLVNINKYGFVAYLNEKHDINNARDILVSLWVIPR